MSYMVLGGIAAVAFAGYLLYEYESGGKMVTDLPPATPPSGGGNYTPPAVGGMPHLKHTGTHTHPVKGSGPCYGFQSESSVGIFNPNAPVQKTYGNCDKGTTGFTAITPNATICGYMGWKWVPGWSFCGGANDLWYVGQYTP
jgi:hypothetical protein